MIKKVKIASVFVNEEKEITSKKDGKVYKLVEANCKMADDSKEYPGKYCKITFFGDEKKNATAKAEGFKAVVIGTDTLINITERSYVNKDGVDSIALDGKLLSKKEQEVAKQFLN